MRTSKQSKTRWKKKAHSKYIQRKWQNRYGDICHPCKSIHRSDDNDKKYNTGYRKNQEFHPRGHSAIIDYLKDHSFTQPPVTHSKRKVTIQIPTTFSLIDNPVESLRTLESLRAAVCSQATEHICFDHSECKQLELDASIVMDSMVIASQAQRRLKFEGNEPFDERVKEIFNLTGLPKHLNLSRSMLSDPILAKYERFELVIGHHKEDQSGNPGHSTEAERTNSKLTQYFDRLLSKFGMSLTDLGRKNLAELIGEVLDNAEIHSGIGQSYVIGYMEQGEPHEGQCHLVIMNYGKSIAESLQEAPINKQTSLRIKALVKRHRKRRLFSPTWEPSNLWTLYALQEGVSRLNIEGQRTDRGYGTIRMIEFFENIVDLRSTDKPQMVMISGDTLVMFDGTYLLQTVEIGEETREIIAFNANNDLTMKPDPKYVVKLPLKFPGTVISLRFKLNRDYLNLISQ
jgi:hypothetical protein